MDKAKLRIKSPSAALPDIYLEVALSDTILRVKELICDDYPQHPAPKDQKLVYSGRLLQDQEFIKNVLRFEDECTHYTIHLVCKIKENKSATPNNRSSSSTVSYNTSSTNPSANHESNSDGLRQRRTHVPEEGTAAYFHQAPTTQTQLPVINGHTNLQQSTRPQTEEERQLEEINRTLQDLITQSPNMSAGELAIYQQVYMQYISLNTQFLQQGAVGGSINPVNIAAVPLNGNVEAVANAVNNNNIGDNAGGEMIQAGANENVPAAAGVDPLEYAYSILRIAVLFCIMYSHSSFFRLLFVIIALAGVYFFRNRNDQAANNNNNVANNRRQRNNAIEEQVVDGGANLVNAPNATENSADETSESEEGTEIVEEEPKPNILSVAFTFISTLVSSILPDNANIIQ